MSEGRRDPLSRLAQLAVAEELSAMMRHTTRNRLAVVRNALTYMHRRLADTEAWRRDPRIETFYGMAQSELDGASEALEVRGMLAAQATPPERRVEPVDPRDCVGLAIEGLAMPGARAVVEIVDVTLEPAFVSSDVHELALAIRCLLQNAVDAVGAGGRVCLRGTPGEGHYLFEVDDNGPSVSEEQMARWVEPFFTTREGRVGLGLNVARRIAGRGGGKLRLARSGQGGTSATLSVPLHPRGSASFSSVEESP
jgi:signal transduction histidine kinase